mgnify:FL=1
MYNILIVDDEKLHRKGLYSLLEEICPSDMVWEASDGIEALEILEHISCEIVISDIRMTKMDGIELLKEIRGKNKDIFFVLLSGYAQFNYAREALRLQACAYLLKPVDRQELNETINDVKKKIIKHRNEERKAADQEERLKETVPAYVDRILNQFVQDPKFSAGDQLVSLLPLKQQGYLFLIKADSASEDGHYFEKAGREIGHMIKKFFDPVSSLTFELHSAYHTLATFVVDEELPNMNKLEELSGIIEKKGFSNIFIAVSELKDNLFLQRCSAYEEAIEALDFSFYETKNLFFHENTKVSTITDPEELNNNDFFAAVQNRKIKKARELFESMLRHASQEEKTAPVILKKRTVFLFYQLLKKLGPLIEKDQREKLYERDQALIQTESFQQLLKEGQQLIFIIANCISHQKSADGFIKGCKEYLETHYMDEISLESVAALFHFNPSYFSTLFKNLFGISFSAFLCNIRIDKAEELLINTDKKIKEVAASTGYRDPNYFIRSFKKKHGLTPDEFRKRRTYEKEVSREVTRKT